MQTNEDERGATTPAANLGEKNGRDEGVGEDGNPINSITTGAKANSELSEEHQAVLSVRAISDAVRDARGYESIDAKTSRKLGFPGKPENLSGLRIPIIDVHGAKHAGQLRPDNPATDAKGKPKKYVFPPASKQRAMVDVHPWHHAKLGNPKIPLLVTESILKADSATSGWGDQLCVIGESGCYGHRGTNADGGRAVLGCYESVAIEGRTIYIVPDSDVATNPNVYHATQRKKAYFESRGGIVHIVKLPDKPNSEKQGLDDWRAANPSATLADLLRLIADDLKAPDSLKPYPAIKAEIDANFAVIESYSQIYNLKTEKLVPARTFKEVDAAPYRFVRGDGEPASGADAWLKDRERRTHRGLEFRPGEPRITAANALNECIDPGIVPIQPDGASNELTELVGFVASRFEGKPDSLAYFWQTRAWPIVHPKNPKMVAMTILISNTHGAGKDAMFEMFAPQYGKHARRITSRDLHNQFNDWEAGALYVVASEVCAPDRREDGQLLKTKATDKTIYVNIKNKPKFEHPNYANYSISSNYIDAVFVDRGERRYFVERVTENKVDEALVRRLVSYAESERGKAEINWYLKNRVSLENFRPQGDALQTETLREMQEVNTTPLWRYTRDVIEGSLEPFGKSDVWQLSEIQEGVPDKISKGTDVSTALAKNLSNQGAANLGKVRVDGENTQRLWAIRNAEKWQKSEGPVIAAEWNRRFDEDKGRVLSPLEKRLKDRVEGIIGEAGVDAEQYQRAQAKALRDEIAIAKRAGRDKGFSDAARLARSHREYELKELETRLRLVEDAASAVKRENG